MLTLSPNFRSKFRKGHRTIFVKKIGNSRKSIFPYFLLHYHLKEDITANPEELAINNNDPSSEWINLDNRMRMENHLNVSNITCNIAVSSVGLNDDPHAHNVHDEHSIYDDLNTRSSHCTGNVNNPAYFSADSGPMPVSPETCNVTQDAINDLSHDAPELLNESYQSLKVLRRKNINRIILAHLNINSV